MSQYASTSIPKPKSWQDFENHTCVLFQCILNDPNTASHGRVGQSQRGVDIYGRRERRDNHWVGIQCKQKGDAQEVTRDELEKEVAEAKKFRPTLTEFILVTTAPDDAKIQHVARDITQRHEQVGLFSVDVWGWGTLEREITKYRDAIDAFHPDLAPFSRQLTSVSEQTLAIAKEQSSKQDQMLDLLHQVVAANFGAGESAADTSTAAEEAIEKNVHNEIDGYRDLLRNGKAKTAKHLLESLKGRVWESASARVRFRITTNIGAAMLSLGEDRPAAEVFLEAIAYGENDPVGLANVALAYLLMKESQKANIAARQALDHDPENAAAAGYLITGHISDETVTDPFSLVPGALHDTPEVLASAINFFAQRNNSEWRRLACMAAEKHGDERQFQRRAAEAVLDRSISPDQLVIGAIPESGLTIKDLRHSASVLRNIWNDTLEEEGELSDKALPHNLALALWGLREIQAAATVLDQALERCTDDRDLRELRAALYLETDDLAAAQALIGDETSSTGLAIMQAQALVTIDPQRARSLIKDNDFRSASQHQRLVADQVIVESFIREGLWDVALDRAGYLVDEYPWSIIPLIELAKTQRDRIPTEAEKTLSLAVDNLGNERRFSERFMLANALEEAGRYDDVVGVLQGHVDTSYDSAALRLLLFSYINADRRAAAHKLLESLPDELVSQPTYRKALVAVNANRKDFPAALEALERYFESYPDDLEMRLRWFQFCFRLDKQSCIEEYIKGDVERLPGHPEHRIELAHWLNQFGFQQRALKLAYAVYLYNSSSPEVHLRFVGLILPPGRNNSIPIDLQTIDENVAFEIDDGQGGRLWFVVEPDETLRKDETFISSDNDIAQKARGLCVGDKLEWGGYRAPWTVLTIKHKYLHALHRSMKNYERYFPNSNGLRQVGIDLKAKEPFKEIFQNIKNRHDHVQKVYDLLDEKMVPIHVAASGLNTDIIEVRYGLHCANRKHRVCAGTSAERVQAFEAIEENGGRGCVVDALTLNTIRRLGMEDTVREMCGPIGITGSTRDIYWTRLKEMQAENEPAMRIHFQDGEYVRHEPSQEEWSEALQIREADLKWIDENTKIIPAEASNDPTADLRKLNEVIGHNFIDDMVAAQGSEMLLLCQDQAYRVFAEKSLGIRGSWLQPLLMLARDRKLLLDEEYNEAVTALVDSGDQFISIDSRVLLWAARHEQDPFERFVRLAKRLGGTEADILSHIQVAINFLGVVWSERPVKFRTQKQTSILLGNLLRGNVDWRRVVGFLRRLHHDYFGPNPDLDHYILNWLQGHFFVPFEKSELPWTSIKGR